MSRLKRLIHETHRRSLWQVLGIYLVTGWVILQFVDTLAGALNLPDWAPSFALFLLIVGLPIVLATAFVQQGFRSDTQTGEEEASNEGDPSPESSPSLDPHPLQNQLFTWRNAIAGGVLAFALWGVVAAAWLWSGSANPDPTADSQERPSVAVLPFANESTGGPDDAAFFSRGIHDEVITRLSQIGALRVISRASVMRYAQGGSALSQVADELGVGALVEGGVQRAGDRVRMNVQLIEPTTGENLWADSYETDLTTDNIFAIQADIARKITVALEAELTPQETALLSDRPTANLEAYDFFLRGTERVDERYTEDDSRYAQRMFEQAVRLDPDFAVAWSRLARTHAELFWFYDRRPERAAAAREAVERARALAPEHPATRIALGQYYYHVELDYERGLRQLELGRELAPNDVWTIANIGYIQRRMGLWDLAVENMERALELDPNSARITMNLAISHQWLHSSDLADEQIDRTLELSPDWSRAIGYRAMFSLYDDDAAAALTTLEGAEAAGVKPTDDPFLALAWVRVLIHARRYLELVDKIDAQSWGLVQGQLSYFPSTLAKALALDLAGEADLARAEYQLAVDHLEGAAARLPEDERVHSALGLAYAGLGRSEDAIREGELGVALMPRSQDPVRGYYREEDLARIHASVGSQDRATELFDILLAAPGYLTTRFLRSDPGLEALRNTTGFTEMLGRHEG